MESFFLKEWVDHFFLCDNNSKDNSFEVIKPYIEKGLIDYQICKDKFNNFLEFENNLHIPF